MGLVAIKSINIIRVESYSISLKVVEAKKGVNEKKSSALLSHLLPKLVFKPLIRTELCPVLNTTVRIHVMLHLNDTLCTNDMYYNNTH